ncbi:MAG: SGNH/GDSL hydrolase family protein [Moraxellaceae bacterium]|nr:SGNH/GDSL hydrolase family protein [Moraxellaceae bacterium]
MSLPLFRRFAFASATMVAIACCATAMAQTTTAATAALLAPGRWESSIAAFEQADRLKAPATGGVVFVGSSSIRMWEDLERQFGDSVVITKRGFGGSRLEDCKQYLSRIVVPYRPRMVVVYAGDNDLAEGHTPQEVLASFRGFVEGVRSQLPDTRIAFVSIKPSPSRASLLKPIRETNALISDYVTSGSNLDFIDIFTPMLAADGMPRGELFRADALHLNDSGYALWKTVIAGHLR